MSIPSPSDIAAAWPRDLREVGCLVVDRTDSTQRLGRAILERYLDEDEAIPVALIVAVEQSAGRGRQGRGWTSDPGRGVWASWIQSVREDLLASVVIRAAVALAEMMADLGIEIALKWPNDLVVGRRKLGGLLADAVARGEGSARRTCAVVGFGVNLFPPLASIEGAHPVSLADLVAGRTPDLAELVVRCARALRRGLRDGAEDWLERYRALVAHRPGDTLRCLLGSGEVEGRFVGFDEHGFLLLETSEGVRCLSSGEVFAW